ncbi:MAG: VOC family protein [Gammaproteobacteria bacterium]
MTDDNPRRTLSKPSFDIGFFTNNPRAVLAFWRGEMGLEAEPPVPFNDGLTQYRHALGGSVLKVNTAEGGVATGVPSGFRELFVARDDISTPRRLEDPDGNLITLVPPGYEGITGVGVRIAVPDLAAEHRFFTAVMGFAATAADAFTSGDTRLFLTHEPGLAQAGHWVNAGFRYVTLHVMRIDAEYADMVARGATEGERPYDIGRLARISFVRDPFGNWFEVAQRAALAGPWWEA